MEPVVTFRGGRIRVDSRARVVLVDGRPAKLGGRAFDVLDALIRRSDRVVPKQELLDVVWPGLVVEENNLQVHVMSLRKLLGTDSIRTVSGRGYQFTLWADAGPDAQTVNRPVVPERTEAEAAPGTTLIGRDELIASTCALLLQEGVRLVTLTGAGGSGKTRVALRVSADLAHEFDDGSYVVMLAPVRRCARLFGDRRRIRCAGVGKQATRGSHRHSPAGSFVAADARQFRARHHGRVIHRRAPRRLSAAYGARDQPDSVACRRRTGSAGPTACGPAFTCERRAGPPCASRALVHRSRARRDILSARKQAKWLPLRRFAGNSTGFPSRSSSRWRGCAYSRRASSCNDSATASRS